MFRTKIQTICNSAILLEKGKLIYQGGTTETIKYYLERKAETAALRTDGAAQDEKPPSLQQVSIREAGICGVRGERIVTGEDMRIYLTYDATESMEDCAWAFSIWTRDNKVCISEDRSFKRVDLSEGEHELSCIVKRVPLAEGKYLLKAGIVDRKSKQAIALFGWMNSPPRIQRVRSRISRR